MTYNEIINIAKRLDDETKERIDEEVAERLEILKLGDLNEEQMDKMEECLYMSLVIQEYLDGEYELIDEERAFLLAEMEELYGEYNDLLLKAKLEEKVSKKKRLALELMRIREKLFHYKDRMRDVKQDMKANRKNKSDLEDLSSKKKMKEVAKENKKSKISLEDDSQRVKQNNKREGQERGGITREDVIHGDTRQAIEEIARGEFDKIQNESRQHDETKRDNEATVRQGETPEYVNDAIRQAVNSVPPNDSLANSVVNSYEAQSLFRDFEFDPKEFENLINDAKKTGFDDYKNNNTEYNKR